MVPARNFAPPRNLLAQVTIATQRASVLTSGFHSAADGDAANLLAAMPTVNGRRCGLGHRLHYLRIRAQGSYFGSTLKEPEIALRLVCGVGEKVATVKRALTLGIAGCAIMASAACGGGGGGGLKGHSPAYDAGYKAGDNFTNMQLQMATMSCAMAYE